jgi:hypothetical protein
MRTCIPISDGGGAGSTQFPPQKLLSGVARVSAWPGTFREHGGKFLDGRLRLAEKRVAISGSDPAQKKCRPTTHLEGGEKTRNGSASSRKHQGNLLTLVRGRSPHWNMASYPHRLKGAMRQAFTSTCPSQGTTPTVFSVASRRAGQKLAASGVPARGAAQPILREQDRNMHRHPRREKPRQPPLLLYEKPDVDSVRRMWRRERLGR